MTPHIHLSLRLRVRGAKPLLHLYDFGVDRDNTTLMFCIPLYWGKKVININGRLTQLWFFIYVTVGQQTGTCFDRSGGQH